MSIPAVAADWLPGSLRGRPAQFVVAGFGTAKFGTAEFGTAEFVTAESATAESVTGSVTAGFVTASFGSEGWAPSVHSASALDWKEASEAGRCLFLSQVPSF